MEKLINSNETTTEKEHSKEKSPVMCVNECGFYGSHDLDNYCSQCFKQKKRKEVESDDTKQNKLQKAVKNDSGVNNIVSVAVQTKEPEIVTITSAEPASVSSSAAQSPDEKRKIVSAQKCSICSKKLALTDIKCRCGEKFCPKHRYPDQHPCKFDYKEAAKKDLAAKNPKVVASKIESL